MYWGYSGVTVGSAQDMNSSCPASGQPKTLWTRFSLSYNLLSHLSLGACVTQILATVWPRLCVHYCQNWSIFLAGEGCASLGFRCIGVGLLFFSESYLLCLSSSFVPILPPILLLCFPILPNLPHPPNFGKHICNICVHCGMGPLFHLMLYL